MADKELYNFIVILISQERYKLYNHSNLNASFRKKNRHNKNNGFVKYSIRCDKFPLPRFFNYLISAITPFYYTSKK